MQDGRGRRNWRRAGAAVSAGVLAAALAAGCTTYARRSRDLRLQLAAQNYEAALQGLEAINNGGSRLLYHYERGLVLHYQNRFAESNAALDQAELVLEDLYTRDLTREVAAFVTSDNLVQYRGERFEAGILHYYKIMNYLHLGLEEEAAVECRRLNHRLQVFGDQDGSYYRNDPFLQYLTGLVYSLVGQHADANVSLRAALAAYRSLRQAYGVEFPAALACDLRDNAALVGGAADAEAAAAATRCAPLDSAAARLGTLNLFLEVGYVPARLESKIFLPIYKNEIKEDLDHAAFARDLARRRGRPVARELKLEYLLEVAMPVLAATPTPVEYSRVRPVAADGTSLAPATTDLVENLAPLAAQAFQEHEGEILVRAVVRSLAKYLATRETKKKSGDVAGWAMNAMGLATETADTRGWSTLPEKILMSRLRLPEGKYSLEVELLDRSGRHQGELRIPDIAIRRGQSAFLNYRVF